MHETVSGLLSISMRMEDLFSGNKTHMRSPSKVRARSVQHCGFRLCESQSFARTFWLPLSHCSSASSKLYKGAVSTSFLHFLCTDSPHNPVKSDFLPHSSAKTAESDVLADPPQGKSKGSFCVLIVWQLAFLTAPWACFSSSLFVPSAVPGPNSSSSLLVGFPYCTKGQWLEPRPIICLFPRYLLTFIDDFLIHMLHPDLSFKPQVCISSCPTETLYSWCYLY